MTSKIDVICDHSQQGLEAVPLRVLDMCNLQMLYLEGNYIEKLPEDIFRKLPRLIWLDLRNNRLTELPSDIAYHPCLENLLLEDNRLQKLPNELGLVPLLQVLQVGNNPLLYPDKSIIEKGTNAICSFLKAEYNKENGLTIPDDSNETRTSDQNQTKKTIKSKRQHTVSVRELLRKSAQDSRLHAEHIPVISIRALSTGSQPVGSNQSPDNTIVLSSNQPKHPPRVTRYCSKLSVAHPHYNSNKYVGMKKSRPPDEGQILDQELKVLWIGKLKGLLTDQEKLLQQERNLQALSSWRLKKKLEPPRKLPAQIDDRKATVPYDTDPDYDRMPSRQELSKDVEKIIKKRRNCPKRSADMQKLINEVISQLKTLEATDRSTASTDVSELEKSEKEIQRIIEIHKKVTELQLKNQSTW